MRESGRRRGRFGVLLVAAAVVAGACSEAAPSTGANRPVSSTTTTIVTGGSVAAPGSVPTGGPITLDAKIKLTSIGTFDNPTAMTSRKGTSTLYVAEQPGRIRSVHINPRLDAAGNAIGLDYAIDPCCVLDIHDDVGAGGERGLLGLVFSTDGRKLYTYFTDPTGRIHLVQFTMTDNKVDLRTRRELFSLDHPRPNHNGGQLAFGPDGYLYIGIGDGGGRGDPDNNGQNTSTLYGKVLRIDPEGVVNDAIRYSIPPGNPFTGGKGGAPEVWIYGARNPWRFSFDRLTGELWVGDVGQDEIEEIDRLTGGAGGAGKGVNLGWNQMEGSRPYNGGSPPPNSVLPIFEYTHDNKACSVIGGYVYRGAKVPALAGVYLYGDYCIGDIRGLLTQSNTVIDDADLGVNLPHLSSFGEDALGELYALSQDGGLYTIDPA